MTAGETDVRGFRRWSEGTNERDRDQRRRSFSVGRAGTSYTAEVTVRDGKFLVTKDVAGTVRKVRPGSVSTSNRPAVIAS